MEFLNPKNPAPNSDGKCKVEISDIVCDALTEATINCAKNYEYSTCGNFYSPSELSTL